MGLSKQFTFRLEGTTMTLLGNFDILGEVTSLYFISEGSKDLVIISYTKEGSSNFLGLFNPLGEERKTLPLPQDQGTQFHQEYTFSLTCTYAE